MNYLFCLLLTCLSYASFAQGSVIRFELYYWEKLPSEYLNARGRVGLKWGIRFTYPGMGLPDDIYQLEFGAYNDSVKAVIQQVHGADWEERFKAEILQEKKQLKIAYQLIKEQPLLQRLEEEVVLFGFHLVDIGNGCYQATGTGFNNDTDFIYNQYCVFQVDTVNGSITILDDRVLPKADE